MEAACWRISITGLYVDPCLCYETSQGKNIVMSVRLNELMKGHLIVFRGRKIKEIEASFEACKSLPVHATNKKLQPVEVLPLLPDFDR